jgi:hypothetical protein
MQEKKYCMQPFPPKITHTQLSFSHTMRHDECSAKYAADDSEFVASLRRRKPYVGFNTRDHICTQEINDRDEIASRPPAQLPASVAWRAGRLRPRGRSKPSMASEAPTVSWKTQFTERTKATNVFSRCPPMRAWWRPVRVHGAVLSGMQNGAVPLVD